MTIFLSKKKKFCRICFKDVTGEKKISVISLILLILSICSFGALLIVWFVYEFIFLQIFHEDQVMNPFYYKCPNCKMPLLP